MLASLQCPKVSFFPNFAFLVVPIILSVCWTDYTELKLLLFCIAAFLMRHKLTNPFTNKKQGYIVESGAYRYQFITYYRSLLLIATCVSILAVDFPIYPRRFVKTEVKGVSLMDIGTGSVLFSSALVARHNRGAQSLSQRIPSAISSCLPLWIIGISKFFIHSAVDYQEHVSEYGVHWNFFMSLGVVVLLSAVLSLGPFTSIVFSATSMAAYQIALNSGLEEYILNAPRTDFISMNREGIFGCIGFLCIYQIGVAMKEYVLVPGKEGVNMAVATLAFSVASFVVGGESRRLVRDI